jgi:hypothetical protein
MLYAYKTMKRTMIIVPDDVDAQLRFEASRRGVPIAEVAREALEAYLAPRAQPGRLSFFAVGAGSPDDVSERVDEFVVRSVRRHRSRRPG